MSEASTAITVTQSHIPAMFSDGELAERVLSEIETKALSIAPDTSTDKGRKAIASLAHDVAKSKVALDTAGKELTEEARATVTAVNAVRKTITTRLDALKAKVRQPLEAWETAEQTRKDELADRFTVFDVLPEVAALPSAEIQQIIDKIDATETGEEWAELEAVAEPSKQAALKQYSAYFLAAEEREAAAVQAEKDRAELEELRAMKAAQEAKNAEAERERIAAEQAEARKAEIAAAEERAAEEATKRAEQEKAEAEKRHAQELQDAKAEAERKSREKEAARLRAEQAEREEQEKREANTRHRNKIKRAVTADLASLWTGGAPTTDQVAAALIEGKISHTKVSF